MEEHGMTDEELLALLKADLTIEATFTGWDYGGVSNDLLIEISFKDVVVAKTRVYIEPVSHEHD